MQAVSSIQFPTGIPVDMVAGSFTMHDPTEVFDDSMLLVDGSRRVELIWAPSEVDDALAMWFPDDGLLCGGAATPDYIPNIDLRDSGLRFGGRRLLNADALR